MKMIKKILAVFILLLFLPPGVLALPVYKDVRQNYVKSDSLLLDRHGAVLHELRIDKKARRLDWIGLADVSPALREAVIHAEDQNFYSHAGVDYRAIGNSLIGSLLDRRNIRGASTITMQLTSFLDPQLKPRKSRRSLGQKYQQIVAARDLEKQWTKQEIFEAYLNLVTFYSELQGVAAASMALFGKQPHGLDQTDAAIMAALIRSPNASADAVFKRASQIAQSLNWQVNADDLHNRIKKIFWGTNYIAPRTSLAEHVAERLLKDKPRGSTVSCTLDANLQRFTQNSLKSQLMALKEQNVGDGAALVLDNKTGQVLAYVTYSNTNSTAQYVDGVAAKRQAGSILKPFLYGLAFNRRILTAASILNDAPLDISVAGGIYQPHNYDSSFRGPVSARVALASSLNVPAVLTLNLVGTEAFLNKLRKMGIKDISESGDYYGPSLALGSADISLWEITNAYRMLANGGKWNETYLSPDKPKTGKFKTIFSPEASFIVSDILSDREARSSTFGLENSLATKFWSAVKTGTSKDMRDNWCVGYSSQYTVGVWVGNYSGASMWNVSGVSGAAPVWHEVMNYLNRQKAGHKISVPPNVVKREILSPSNIRGEQEEWFIRGTEPSSEVQIVKQYNGRIIYPPSGTIIALDPDIPQDLQKVFFITRAEDQELKWKLNDTEMPQTGKTVEWSPQAGHYKLELTDQQGKFIDSVRFEVRGSEQAFLENDAVEFIK